MFKKVRENDVRPVVDTGPGLTKQSMKDDTDINLIMAKYQRTGLVSFVSTHEPEYMDTGNTVDFQQALNTVMEAQSMFDDLPSSIRKKFDNNPAQFLEFVQNPDNKEAVYDMGLATRPAQAQAPEIPGGLPPEPPEIASDSAPDQSPT